MAQYVASHRPWRVELSVASTSTRSIEQVNADGLILPVITEPQRDAVLKLGIPTVSIAGNLRDTGFPVVTVDHEAVGRLAAEFFLQRGFEHMAYCGIGDRYYSPRRGRGFHRTLEKAGIRCHVHEKPAPTTQPNRAGDHKEQLRGWLKTLPKPCAMFVCDDLQAVELLEAARLAGVRVPDDLAVLSVDNDELSCNLSDPPLSSIDHGTQQIGYQAGNLLDRMLRGEKVSHEPVVVPPSNIVLRRSTDTYPNSNPHINLALAYMRRNLTRRVQVDEIVEASGVSRRVLENAFRTVIHRSILDEYHRLQTEAITHLLRNTTLPLKQIAQQMGFSNVYYFSAFFKRSLGVPPGQYRKTTRMSEGAANDHTAVHPHSGLNNLAPEQFTAHVEGMAPSSPPPPPEPETHGPGPN